MSSHTTRRACASIPAVGSSRKTNRAGRRSRRPAPAVAADRPTAGGRWFGGLGQTEGVQKPGRVQRPCGVGGHQIQHLGGPGRRISAAALKHHTDAFAHLRVVGDRVQAQDLHRAGVGADEPSHISTVVVFPAPLGPSSASTSARWTSRSRSRTALGSPVTLRHPTQAHRDGEPELTGSQRRRRVPDHPPVDGLSRRRAGSGPDSGRGPGR